LVTKNGHENLTTAVKDVDEMEKLINGSLKHAFDG